MSTIVDEPPAPTRGLRVVPDDAVLGGPVGAGCAALREVIDGLQVAELGLLCDAEVVAALVEVETQARRLPTVRDALLAEVQARGVPAARGFRSPGAWLRSRFQLGAGEARAWLRGAELLTPTRPISGGAEIPAVLAATAAARATGALSPAQVKVIDDFCDELPVALPAAVRRTAEAVMVDYARDVGPVELTRFGQRLLDHLHPDGTEPSSADAHRRRGITIGPLRRGLARISVHVDAWTREAILTVLTSLSDHDPTSGDREPGDPKPGDVDRLDPTGETADSTPSDQQCEGAPNGDLDAGDGGHRDDDGEAVDARDGDHWDSDGPGGGALDADGEAVDARDGGHRDDDSDGPGGGAVHVDVDGGSGEPPMAPAPAPAPLDPDRRSHPQRMHDALREACERLLSAGGLPRRGGTPATILLTVALATLEKRTGLVATAHGGDIPIREVIRRAADSTLIPIVLDERGNPLLLGRSQRLASRAQRYALHVRDGGCVIPGCTTPSQDCHTHHLHDWALGGETNLDNLTLLCPYHHYRIHDWTLQLHNGRIWCTPHHGSTTPKSPDSTSTSTAHPPTRCSSSREVSSNRNSLE